MNFIYQPIRNYRSRRQDQRPQQGASGSIPLVGASAARRPGPAPRPHYPWLGLLRGEAWMKSTPRALAWLASAPAGKSVRRFTVRPRPRSARPRRRRGWRSRSACARCRRARAAPGRARWPERVDNGEFIESAADAGRGQRGGDLHDDQHQRKFLSMVIYLYNKDIRPSRGLPLCRSLQPGHGRRAGQDRNLPSFISAPAYVSFCGDR